MASPMDEGADSRTSAVGRGNKRASNQTSQNNSTASSPDGDQPHPNSRKSRKRKKQADKENNEDDQSSGKRSRIESEVEKENEPATGNTDVPKAAAGMSWNKGVQPVVRTSFGAVGRLVAKANKVVETQKEVNFGGGAELQSKEQEEAEDQDLQRRLKKEKNAQREKKKKENKKKRMQEREVAVAQSDYTPTQKLKFGDVEIQYSLAHAPREGAPGKIKAWIRRDLQNRFIPNTLSFNKDILEDVTEDMMIEVCKKFAEEQPLYDKDICAQAHEYIGDTAFRGFIKNQMRNVLKKRQNDRKEEQKNGGTVVSQPVENVVDVDTSLPVSNDGDGSGDDDENDEDDDDDEEDASSSDEDEVSDTPKTQTETINIVKSEDEHSPQEDFPHADSNAQPKDSQLDAATTAATSTIIDLTAPEKAVTPEDYAPVPGLFYDPNSDIEYEKEVSYYFSHPPSEVTCLVCRDPGHQAGVCPKLTCNTCGTRGEHFEYACPQNVICSKCRAKGHLVADCTERLAKTVSEGVICAICESERHIEDNCHFLWRSFNPDNVIVFHAESDVRTVDGVEVRALTDKEMLIDCYQCGASGHFGTECGLRRGQRGSVPYASQTWTLEKARRWMSTSNTSSAGGMAIKGTASRSQNGTGMGMKIKGTGGNRNEAISLDSSEDDRGPFIRPRVNQPKPPSKGSMKLSDRITRPNPPLPSGPSPSNLPQYAIQPPPTPPSNQNWAAVNNNGSGTYRDLGNYGFDSQPTYDDFKDGDDYYRFDGQDHDRDYRQGNGPQGRAPFRANTARNGNDNPRTPSNSRGGGRNGGGSGGSGGRNGGSRSGGSSGARGGGSRGRGGGGARGGGGRGGRR